ncbi:Lipid A export ATP-binding/permease protein msbA [Agrobacterium tumefaciens]|nr:Lipid A export ATP-binding/permease protein msbA [Agrobacterium tumefaciens]
MLSTCTKPISVMSCNRSLLESALPGGEESPCRARKIRLAASFETLITMVAKVERLFQDCNVLFLFLVSLLLMTGYRTGNEREDKSLEIRFDAAGVAFEGRQALQPLSLTLIERRIGVIGLNGSGKTTFARLINGLNKPSQGKVLVNGLDTVADAKAILQMVGFIFQNPQNQIILPIVRDDVAFGLKRLGLGKTEIENRVKAVLARLAVSHLEERRAHELSGGELQLAALAALLVTEPQILILDEPTNQLDLKNRAIVEKTMAALSQSLIVITHDLPLLQGFDRVLVFHGGALVADAGPEEAVARYLEVAAQ